jgi:hypothetical protein
MRAVVLHAALAASREALSGPAMRITPDAPGGPGSDWSSSRVLAISLSIGAILVLPLAICMAHRCYVTNVRKKRAAKILEARAAAVLEARQAAVAEARAEGNAARADHIQAIIDRDANTKVNSKDVQTVRRAGNYLDGYAQREGPVSRRDADGPVDADGAAAHVALPTGPEFVQRDELFASEPGGGGGGVAAFCALDAHARR